MRNLTTWIEPKHLLKHPFYQRWMEGTLTLDELRSYAANYFPHVLAFPTYVSAVHSQCDDMTTRQALLENLIEEERGEENHPELWLRFGEAVGISRNEIVERNKIPEATALVETFQKLTRKSFAAGLGALYAYESQVPQIAEQKIAGLKKNYGITNERGLEFFSVHQAADQYHAQTEADAMEKLSEDDWQEAKAAAVEASDALWNFLSGLDQARCN